jgi:catechol 2,3-dioxygenase-like lactoylglutathione lyase family enzyme
VINQLNLVVRDMEATVAFYRRLGLSIDADIGAEHVNVELGNGFRLEFDLTSFVPLWDSAFAGATGGSTVVGWGCSGREEVDRLYRELIGAGARSRQPPYDAFWGARYAIVEDPDGNPVGLMSPVDPDRRSWPPAPPPAAG